MTSLQRDLLTSYFTSQSFSDFGDPELRSDLNLMSNDQRCVGITNLTKACPDPYGDDLVVVRDFDLIVRRDEFVCVIGHWGCGKSTVPTMLPGSYRISSGSLAVNGRDVSGPGPDRPVVFRAPYVLRWMRAFEDVMPGVEQGYPGGAKAEPRDTCQHYLNPVEFSDGLRHDPKERSGGMQQQSSGTSAANRASLTSRD